MSGVFYHVWIVFCQQLRACTILLSFNPDPQISIWLSPSGTTIGYTMEIYSEHLYQTVPILAVPVNVFSKMKYRNVINGS